MVRLRPARRDDGVTGAGSGRPVAGVVRSWQVAGPVLGRQGAVEAQHLPGVYGGTEGIQDAGVDGRIRSG